MTSADERDHSSDAARLAAALAQSEDVTCARAEAMIAILVEAEAMGKPVDDDPQFAPILRHLDNCAECLSLYEGLSEEFAATIREQLGRQPNLVQPFAPQPGSERQHSAVLPTRFERTIRPLERRQPAFVRERPEPYAAQPPEPRVEIDLVEEEHGLGLHVRMLDHVAGNVWLVSVTTDGFRANGRTNAEGVAIFHGVPTSGTIHVVGEVSQTID